MKDVMQRRSIAVLFALGLSACSGGAGGSAPAIVAPAKTASPGGGSQKTASATVAFVINIPNATNGSAARPKPNYISPGTSSIVVSEGTAKSSISVTIDVPSSSCTSTNLGLTCNATLLAPVGSDTFTVTTFQGTAGSGNVLSSGTIVQSILGTSANVVPIVLNGVISTLSIALGTTYLPVVDGGTATATLAAKDAAGYNIIGTYFTPVTLSAPSGLTPSAPSITSSAGNSFTVAYDGTSRTAQSVTATSGTVTASAAIVPLTHLHTYTAPALVTGGSVAFPLVLGPDGAMYFGDSGPANFFGNGGAFQTGDQTGVVGRVDPTTGAITQLHISGVDPDGLLFVGNDLYIAEAVTGTVGRVLGAASGGFTQANYSELTLPNAPPLPVGSGPVGYAFPRKLAYENGILYVTSLYDGSLDYIAVANWATGTSAVTRLTTPNRNDAPDGLALGSDGNLYFDGGPTQNVEKYVPGATSIIDSAADPSISSDGTEYTRFIAAGADGKFYVTATADAPNADAIAQYNGSSFTSLAVPTGVAGEFPDSIHPGAGSTIVFNDYENGSSGTYDTSAGTFRLFPTNGGQFAPGFYPNDVADGMDDTYWYTLDTNSGDGPSPQADVHIGRLVLAQAWQVLPEAAQTIDGLGIAGAKIVSIAEAATSHDTVTVKSTTTAICSVSAPAGYTDTYVITGLAPGTCAIAATDQTGRVVDYPIAVSASNLTISARGRSRHVSF